SLSERGVEQQQSSSVQIQLSAQRINAPTICPNVAPGGEALRVRLSFSERAVEQRQSCSVQIAWMIVVSYPRNALAAPTIWSNVGPGTEFFVAETAASIRSYAPAGTKRPEAERKKARQSRAQVASLHKARDGLTGWWVRQGSNL